MEDSRGFPLHGGLGGFTVFGFSQTDLWFTNGNWTSHYDGKFFYDNDLTKAGVFDLQTDGALLRSWGTSSRSMYFIGKKGTIFHFDGTNWSRYPRVTLEDLQSIWGTSDSNIWACGYNFSTGNTVLVHYNGNSWSVDPKSTIPTSQSGGFMSVWSCDSAGHAITFASGSLVYRKTDTGAWRSDSGRVPNLLPDNTYLGLGLIGNAANDVFAIGASGLIIHWNGASWHRYDQFFDLNANNYGTGGASMKGNTDCIVGEKDGASWILVGQRQ